MKANRNFKTFLKYKYSNYVARIEKFASSLGAMALRNKGHPLIKTMISLSRIIGFMVNKSLVKVIISYLRFCSNFARKSNTKSLVLYLKTCSVILQKRLGGDIIYDLTPLGMRVSHSRGIPRIIPVHHRSRIRAGDLLVIRLWLTLFAMNRVMEVKPKISFSSITSKGRNFQLHESFYKIFIEWFRTSF